MKQKYKKYAIEAIAVTLAFFLNGCGHKQQALEHKEQKPDDLKKVIESPISLVMVANIYYAEMGKWPDSIDDLEKFKDNPVSDIDWSSLHDSIVLEKLPEGGLKIISTKPDFNYSVIISKPPQTKKFIPQQ